MSEPNFIDRIKLKKPVPKSSYLNDIPAVVHLKRSKELTISSNVTIFTGENGSGKSTLIEAIAVACGFNAEGGTKNYCFSTNSTHSGLWECIAVSRKKRERDGYFLRAESFYNAATYLEELDEIECAAPPVLNSYGGKSLHKRSHGESFMTLMEIRFGSDGLYILDEPEAALSPMKLMRLLVRIHELEQKGSQFIIATHSPILMTYPGAEILELSQDGIKSVNYNETEHYILTKRFLESPERMYRYLFETGD